MSKGGAEQKLWFHLTPQQGFTEPRTIPSSRIPRAQGWDFPRTRETKVPCSC